MARFGPPKQPEAIAKMKGGYRPSRNKDDFSGQGLQYLKKIPPCPESLDEHGRAFWNLIIGEAISVQGYFAVTDIMMFEHLCYTYQLINDAQKQIKKYGIFRSTADKDIKANGFTKTYMELVKIYITLCREFGLSPSSRTGIKLISKSDTKDFEPDFDI